MRIRGVTLGSVSSNWWRTRLRRLDDTGDPDSCVVSVSAERKIGGEQDLNHKWSLVYDGKDKVFILTEYQQVGEDWHRLSETRWAYIDAPLEHIRKSNSEWMKGDQG
jgi:hypothetical protein